MSINISSNFLVGAGIPLDARTVVADNVARDGIPDIERFQGLKVFVTSTNKNWQLQGGITNGDWVDISATGGATISGSIGITQVAFGSAPNAIAGDANFVWDNTNKELWIGGTPTTRQGLYVKKSYDGTASASGMFSDLTVTALADSDKLYVSQFYNLILAGNFNYTLATGLGQFGMFGGVSHTGSGTVANGVGVYGQYTEIAGTTTNAVGVQGVIRITNPGTIVTGIGLWAAPFTTGGGGTITTAYGAKIDPPGIGATQWTAAVGTGNSYIAGSLSVGKNTAPGRTLDVLGTCQIGNINPPSNSMQLWVGAGVDGTSTFVGIEGSLKITPIADTANSFYGNFYITETANTAFNLTGSASGALLKVFHGGSATLASAQGVFGLVEGSTGTISEANGIVGSIAIQSTGTITTAVALRAKSFTTAGGAVAGTCYGLLIDPPGFGGTQWTAAIGTGNSYVAGSLNVGTSASATEAFEVHGTSRVTSGRFLQYQGANVASPASGNLVLGNDGNAFLITGNNPINAIDATGWSAGSEFSLLFNGILTLKHNTAGDAGTLRMILSTANDITTAANCVITFRRIGDFFYEISQVFPV